MGKYLRKLRLDKKLSQSELCDEFAKNYFEVSVNAISSWEKGKTIPDIDKLNFLSDFYGVTIDDILDGEHYEETDFNQIYHMHQEDYFRIAEIGSKRPKWDIYEKITKEGTIIRAKFKKHIFAYIDGTISRHDTNELLFFLKNDYVFNDNVSVINYLSFLRSLKNKKISNEEKWWEVQRYICPITFMQLTFSNISDEAYKLDVNQERMNYSELWEKDMLLAMIQSVDPVYYDPTKYSSKNIDSYEEKNGKPFNKEEIIKDTIKFLINNGAVLNKNFFGHYKEIRTEFRTIDLFEEKYNQFKKPLVVYISGDGKNNKRYYVENTLRNRLLINHEYQIVKPLKNLGYSIEEIADLIANNEDLPEKIYIKAALMNNIDVNRDMAHIIGDLFSNMDINCLKYSWKEVRAKAIPEKNLDAILADLKNKLEKGNNIITETSYEWVGGSSWHDRLKYVYQIRPSLSFKEFNKGRLVNKTKQLMDEIDELSIKEIREKYFMIGGSCND